MRHDLPHLLVVMSVCPPWPVASGSPHGAVHYHSAARPHALTRIHTQPACAGETAELIPDLTAFAAYVYARDRPVHNIVVRMPSEAVLQ